MRNLGNCCREQEVHVAVPTGESDGSFVAVIVAHCPSPARGTERELRIKPEVRGHRGQRSAEGSGWTRGV